VTPSKSRGIRAVPHACLSGVIMLAGILLIIKGATDTSASGTSGSPLLMLGLFPALLSSIAFVYHVLRIPVVLSLRRGTSAIARWTVSADEFRRFLDADARIERETGAPNFLKPPSTIPATGVEVIFGDHGVLIDDGYFPLSTTKGRRVHRVRSIFSPSPMIEFGTILETRASTSSATTKAVRTAETLRVPIASDAVMQGESVVRRFDVAIARR
jgi:hypothetical protein